MDITGTTQLITATITQVGLRVLGALVPWIVGRALISHWQRVLSRIHTAHQPAISCSRTRGSGYRRSTWRMKSSASDSLGSRPEGANA